MPRKSRQERRRTMVVQSLAPLRIGLAGGGTDVGEYAENHGGLCLNMAINIRQDFHLEPDFKKETYSNDFCGKLLKELDLPCSGFGQFFPDKFIGSGLGSSASAAVALVGAANKINNLGLSKMEIAEKAWDIEVNKIGLFGGRQDQLAAVYGGMNVFQFGKKVTVIPISKSYVDVLYPHLLLFHTGIERNEHKIQEGLKTLTKRQVNILDEIKRLAALSLVPLVKGDIKEFGQLMKESWEYKQKSNNGVSNQQIDAIMEKGWKLGAWGGKLNGSGGGGTVLFVVDPDRQEDFKKQIGLKHIDFSPDYQGLDVRIL